MIKITIKLIKLNFLACFCSSSALLSIDSFILQGSNHAGITFFGLTEHFLGHLRNYFSAEVWLLQCKNIRPIKAIIVYLKGERLDSQTYSECI